MFIITTLRAFSTVVITSGFSWVLVVLFQSHFLSSVLAKFLAKTCFKFMTFWQNRAKFTTALPRVLVKIMPRGSQKKEEDACRSDSFSCSTTATSVQWRIIVHKGSPSSHKRHIWHNNTPFKQYLIIWVSFSDQREVICSRNVSFEVSTVDTRRLLQNDRRVSLVYCRIAIQKRPINTQ